MDANALALVSALTAAAVAVAVAAVVVFRSARADTVAPSGRVRFPARALERAVVVGVFAVALAAVIAIEGAGGAKDAGGSANSEVAIGVAVVLVSLAWLVWRGSFMSLRSAGPPGEGATRRG